MLAAENLESLYSWSLLLWLGNLGLHIVSNVYFIIEWILVTKWEMVVWPLTRCMSAWLLAFLIQLLLLHIVCDFASSQVRQSVRCKVMTRSRSPSPRLISSFAITDVKITTRNHDKSL